MRAGIAPDKKLCMDGSATGCMQGRADFCVWQFANQNNPYTSPTYLRNVNYAGGGTYLAWITAASTWRPPTVPDSELRRAVFHRTTQPHLRRYVDYAPTEVGFDSAARTFQAVLDLNNHGSNVTSSM